MYASCSRLAQGRLVPKPPVDEFHEAGFEENFHETQ
jgi:hypothetical protein